MPDSTGELIWFTAEQIERLNEIVVAKRGEPHTLMSRDLLESALGRARTYQAYNEGAGIIELGVVLIAAIGKNHCFMQGNKRTAVSAGIAFMRANGIHLIVPDTEENAELFEAMIEGRVTLEDVIRFCGSCVVTPA